MSEQLEQVPQEVPLPLEVRVQRRDDGWSVHLPLRAELVRIDKVVEMRERVSVRARMAQDVQRLSDTVRREQLRVDTEGDVRVNRPEGVDPNVRQGR